MNARRLVHKDGREELVPWLFHRKGQPIGDTRKAWATACKAAGCPGLLYHDLRRSFAKDAMDAGADPKTVMDIGGWRTVSMFHRYRITDTKQMAATLGRLEAARHTQANAKSTVIPMIPAAEARSR